MSSDPAVREHVYSIVSRILRIPVSELRDDVLIREELAVDSLLALEILATCGRELDVDVDESECVDLETLGEFVDYLSSKKRQGHSEQI